MLGVQVLGTVFAIIFKHYGRSVLVWLGSTTTMHCSPGHNLTALCLITDGFPTVIHLEYYCNSYATLYPP